MKKQIQFRKEQVGDIVRINARYNGVSAKYERVGDRAKRCLLVGRGNARQIKHLLREFSKSTQAVDR